MHHRLDRFWKPTFYNTGQQSTNPQFLNIVDLGNLKRFLADDVFFWSFVLFCALALVTPESPDRKVNKTEVRYS